MTYRPHLCADTECPFVNKQSSTSCKCHQTQDQVKESLIKNTLVLLERVRVQMGALISDPTNPSIDAWPCPNRTDRECLNEAYDALEGAIGGIKYP